MITATHLINVMCSAVLIIRRDERCSMEFILLVPFIEFFRRIVLGSPPDKQKSDKGSQSKTLVLKKTLQEKGGG